MTAKQIYKAILTELNKLQAPSITLEDFNYFVNKGISQYVNRKYNVYDTTQQTSDDLRVLKSSSILTPEKAAVYSADSDSIINQLYGNTYEVNLPDDYFHILNCICVYQSKSAHSCIKEGAVVQYGANRLTSDMWGEVMNNYYMKPSYKRPYYYLHNVNTQDNSPTNPIILDENNQIISGTDYSHQESDNVPVVKPSTSFIIYYSQLAPQNPADYVFSTNSVHQSQITNSLNVIMDKAPLYLLAIPVNKRVESIVESVTGDQTVLYTDRIYQEERQLLIEEKPYKLIFLGRGNLMSGEYTIKFYG